MTTNEWKQATSGEVIKLKEGERVEGIYLGLKESSEYPNSWAISIKTDEEKKVLFVNNIVKDFIESNGILVGMEIAILFKGMKKTENGKQEYKTYEVFYR